MKLLFDFFHRYTISIVIVIVSINVVQAHPMPNSVMSLTVNDTNVKGEVRIPLKVIEDGRKQIIPDLEALEALTPEMEANIRLSSANEVWKTAVTDIQIEEDSVDLIGVYREAVLYLLFTPNQGEVSRSFDIRFDAFIDDVDKHDVWIMLVHDWRTGRVEDADPQFVGEIKGGYEVKHKLTSTIHLEQGSRWKGFVTFLKIGMDHMRHGADHILFLLTLLLVSPLVVFGRRWSLFQGWKHTFRKFLSVSIAFTIGHSIALVTGALSLLHFNIQWIEAIIALSVMIAALHCIVPLFPKRETIITFIFGCVHGLAFSERIAELDLSLTNKAITILGFNLGIELMQIIIMLLAIPLLWLSRHRLYDYLRTVIGALTVVAATIWLIERLGFTDIPYI